MDKDKDKDKDRDKGEGEGEGEGREQRVSERSLWEGGKGACFLSTPGARPRRPAACPPFTCAKRARNREYRSVKSARGKGALSAPSKSSASSTPARLGAGRLLPWLSFWLWMDASRARICGLKGEGM